MVNKDANIDLLFRDGLKDLEILPPVGVWGSIFPVIRKKEKPYILLRSAALIAVLVSIGFLAYRWGSERSSGLQNPLVALNEESVPFQNNTPVEVLKPQSQVKSSALNATRNRTNGNNPVAAVQSGQENNEISAPEIIPVSNNISNSIDLVKTMNKPVVSNFYFKAENRLQSGNKFQTENKLNDSYVMPDESDYLIPKDNSGKWSLSAVASPSYYLRTQSGSDEISKQVNSSEQTKMSYSGGMGFAYRISKKLSVQSGLYYTSIGQEIENIYSFSGFGRFDNTKSDHNFEVLTSGGVIFTDNDDVFLLDNRGERVLTRYTNDVFDPAKANLSPVSNSLHQTFSYLEMPLILRYKLIDKSIDFNLIGGLSYNLLVNNSVHTYVDGKKYFVGETEGLNTFMVSSSVGMGMEYSLTRKISLNLEPMFRYYLNPFSEMPGIKTHPYSFGVFSGLFYKF
jgi:hypothetical protein